MSQYVELENGTENFSHAAPDIKSYMKECMSMHHSSANAYM